MAVTSNLTAAMKHTRSRALQVRRNFLEEDSAQEEPLLVIPLAGLALSVVLHCLPALKAAVDTEAPIKGIEIIPMKTFHHHRVHFFAPALQPAMQPGMVPWRGISGCLPPLHFLLLRESLEHACPALPQPA